VVATRASGGAGDLLLDCGAGTGLFAEEMARHCASSCSTITRRRLRILRTRFRPEQILSLAGDRVPLPMRHASMWTALDVLEHCPTIAPS